MNEYIKPKNKNAIIILSSGFFLWGKSIGYKGLTVGEVLISNNITLQNTYSCITAKDNIGKMVIFNSHKAFSENSSKALTNMSASGIVIPAFDVDQDLDDFLIKNEITAICDVDTLALINKVTKEGVNKVSALIFNVSDTHIDVNTLYGFLTAFTGKNNKTENINFCESLLDKSNNEPLDESIFLHNSVNNILNVHINGSFHFNYADNLVNLTRHNLTCEKWAEKYPQNKEDMEELKKFHLSDENIANHYHKKAEIVSYNREQWGNFPSYKLYDSLYIPIYSGDGLNNADSQLDFSCVALVIAHNDLDDSIIQSMLDKYTDHQDKIYFLTNNINLINKLKSTYIQLDEFSYPVNFALIVASINSENIGDIIHNNPNIQEVYYQDTACQDIPCQDTACRDIPCRDTNPISNFELTFLKKEINLIKLP